MAIIDNVTFFYTKIQQPGKKYQSEDTEYSVDCCVSKTQVKAWNKQFPKQKAKEFDNEEFLEKFKVEEVPFPDQDEQFVIKLKKAATRDGKETPEKYRPKVLVPYSAGNIDITHTKLVGNGSTGKASYVENSNDFGTFAQLSAILVEKLVEYNSPNSGAGSEFGDIVQDEAKPASNVAEQVPKATPAKKAPKKEEPAEDELGDDTPF